MTLLGHVDEISRSVVVGWVVDAGRPNEAVSVSIVVNGVHRGMCLTSLPRSNVVLPNGEKANKECGFRFAFEPPLSPFIEQRIDVIETWSAVVLPNGSRTLPRPRSSGSDDAGIVPILVTSTGRTGTTLLMSEFARHPDTVVGDRVPYEIKQIGYYSAAFRALAADADRERSTTPDRMLARETHHFVGSNPYNASGLFGLGGSEGALREFYQSTVPSGYATLFRRFIVEFYATLAAAQGKPSARYFCEKSEIDDAAVQGARLFFDVVKDIVIVRDPRDLLCSAIAFWKLQPRMAIIMLGATIPRLARIARHGGPDTIVIRYEDLVRDPVNTRQALSEFLDLDLQIVQNTDGDPIPDSHRTSRDPAASIGRWRNDLTPDQVEACELAFGPYMREFDYELSIGPGTHSRPDRQETPVSQIVVAEGAFAVDLFAETTVAESENGQWRQVLELPFGREGAGEAFTREGWSPPEEGFVWSDAAESLVRLPLIRGEGAYQLHVVASPFTHGTRLPAQRVTVLLNGQTAGTARVRDICVLSIPIPPEMSRSGEAIALTLCFPDAARPSELSGAGDSRTLGFALHRIALFRLETAPDPVNPVPRQSVRQSRAPARYAWRTGATEPDLQQAGPNGKSTRTLIARTTELSREAFKRPELEYRARTSLRDIPGYDATRFVQLILQLEAEFDIALHEDEVDRIVTMGDIVALLLDKVPDGS